MSLLGVSGSALIFVCLLSRLFVETRMIRKLNARVGPSEHYELGGGGGEGRMAWDTAYRQNFPEDRLMRVRVYLIYAALGGLLVMVLSYFKVIG